MKKQYIFSGFVDGIGKCLFTITPLTLAFKNYAMNSGDPIATRVSFFISILSFMFFYITELYKSNSVFVKIESALSIVFLSVSFVLTFLAFTKNYYSFTDFAAMLAFLFASLPLAIETVLAFIYLDCGYSMKTANNKRISTLTRKSGNVSSASSDI